MTTFAELTKQVHMINDLILSDMICENDESEEEVLLTKHLLATKYWFARISYANKKRYLLALLKDVRSAWTLSLLLKSLWNSRLKDAVMSVSEASCCLSRFDQVPMDHNRTALPVTTLAQVMKNDRVWFLTLSPESQALVLSELLTVAGGPAMWEILHRARILYDRYREQMIANIQECTVAHDSEGKHLGATPSVATMKDTTKAQKALEASLATWKATIKSMRDSLKLEEFDVTLQDGSKSKVWKVNRQKPDCMETVDFVQLLPSAVGMKIISYLPRAQLGDYARVNKYWAYLVDEFRLELATRIKIDIDFNKMNDTLFKHDVSLNEFVDMTEQRAIPRSEPDVGGNTLVSTRFKAPQSYKASEKSVGAYSLRQLSEKMAAKPLIAQKPLRNMAELDERLQQRGATDEHIWKWCENIENHVKNVQKRQRKGKMQALTEEQTTTEQDEEGILILGNVHFPCPLMKLSLLLPLNPPLYKDPAKVDNAWIIKRRKSVNTNKKEEHAAIRHNLWARDVSPLYPVFKIPSYHFPPLPDLSKKN